MPKPVTREDFAQLVTDLRAELATTGDDRWVKFFRVPRKATPHAWKGRPWVRGLAGADVLADLTGLTEVSLRVIDRKDRHARGHGDTTVSLKEGMRTRRLMPASTGRGRERRWVLGEVALWMAARDDRHVTRVTTTPREKPARPAAPGKMSDTELLETCRRVVKEHGPGVSIGQIRAMLLAEGVNVIRPRIAPMLLQARIEHIRAQLVPTEGVRGGELEPLRWDGLVTASQVSRAFGLPLGAISHAIRRGNLTPVKYEGPAAKPHPLFDPMRLAVRNDGQKGVVDVGSKYAADMELP